MSNNNSTGPSSIEQYIIILFVTFFTAYTVCKFCRLFNPEPDQEKRLESYWHVSLLLLLLTIVVFMYSLEYPVILIPWLLFHAVGTIIGVVIFIIRMAQDFD